MWISSWLYMHDLHVNNSSLWGPNLREKVICMRGGVMPASYLRPIQSKSGIVCSWPVCLSAPPPVTPKQKGIETFSKRDSFLNCPNKKIKKRRRKIFIFFVLPFLLRITQPLHVMCIAGIFAAGRQTCKILPSTPSWMVQIFQSLGKVWNWIFCC